MSVPALQELTVCFSLKLKVLNNRFPDLTDESHFKVNFLSVENRISYVFNLAKVRASSPWTAFMYLHPGGHYAELGLGGKGGQLVVWLFGMEWSTREVNLNLLQWYQLCLTWTQDKIQPTLYINGEAEDVAAGGGEIKYI